MKKRKRNGYWTQDRLIKEALKYSTRGEFQKQNRSAYNKAIRKNILNKICKHMKLVNKIWTYENLLKESLKYKTRKEFANKNKTAYNISLTRGILNKICKHMPKHVNQSGKNSGRFKWTNEMLQEEALKYNTRSNFKKNNPSAYSAALKRKIMNKICKHMKPSRGSSMSELELLSIIQKKYPSARKMRDIKVKIKWKPFIHAFEIDIFISDLNKGIEFDGKRYHSIEGLIKYKSKKWPIKDALNRHEIKDAWFLSKGIKILHIKEQDWISNKEECIKKCFEFLNQ